MSITFRNTDCFFCWWGTTTRRWNNFRSAVQKVLRSGEKFKKHFCSNCSFLIFLKLVSFFVSPSGSSERREERSLQVVNRQVRDDGLRTRVLPKPVVVVKVARSPALGLLPKLVAGLSTPKGERGRQRRGIFLVRNFFKFWPNFFGGCFGFQEKIVGREPSSLLVEGGAVVAFILIFVDIVFPDGFGDGVPLQGPDLFGALPFKEFGDAWKLIKHVVWRVRPRRELEVALVRPDRTAVSAGSWRHLRSHPPGQENLVAFGGEGSAAVATAGRSLRPEAEVPVGVGGWLKVDVDHGLARPWPGGLVDGDLIEGAELSHLVDTLPMLQQKGESSLNFIV